MNKTFINMGQYNNRHVIKHVTLKCIIYVSSYKSIGSWNCLRLKYLKGEIEKFFYNELKTLK